MTLFKSDQLTLCYEIHGKGPKLIFIPGTVSDLRQRATIFVSPLIEKFEILSLDPRGIGQSNSPTSNPSMQNYAQDIKMLLDHIGWKTCACIGESFGGMIAQEFVLNYPEYVSKLVLVATSSGGSGGSSFPYHKYDVSKMSLEEKADFWVQCGDMRYREQAWKQSKEYQQQYLTYLEVFQLAEQNPNRKLFSERQIYARKHHDTFNRLSQIHCPTYICGGKYDRTAPISNQLALLNEIPHARLSIFKGSHMFLWQDLWAYESIGHFLSFR